MINDRGQKITPLSSEDRNRLSEQRAVVEAQLADDESRKRFNTVKGKLESLQEILKAGVFEKEQTYELQCLGVVLGDALVSELSLKWIMVEDDAGRDPAIQWPGTSVILFPLTMISKRVEGGEEVDVFYLFEAISEKVRRVKKEGA